MGFLAWVFLPILVVDALLAPSWFDPATSTRSDSPEVTQIVLSGVGFPFYLAVVGSAFIWRTNSAWKLLWRLGFLAGASVLGVLLYYVLLGTSTGRFWTPDKQPVNLMCFLAFCGLVVTLLPTLIVLLLRRVFFSASGGARSEGGESAGGSRDA